MIETISLVLAVLLVAAWTRPVALIGLRSLHILQLEEYQTARFWRWLVDHVSDRSVQIVDRPLGITLVVVVVGTSFLPFPLWSAVSLAGVVIGALYSRRARQLEAKKPLVLTARAKRLLIGWVGCVLVVAALVVLGVSHWAVGPREIVLAVSGTILLVGVFGWPLVSLANLLLYPVEASFRGYYLRSAARILDDYRPVVIGVAGSYGKTSTKSILAQILSTRYPALATPRSFNTPMGLCRVIREQLKPDHRYFVAELGAYQRGEIRQLGKLVKPTIGILTAVGPEHLERFGSMENVREAEFEIVEALPSNGLAIFNGDDPTCRELAARAGCRAILAGGPDHDRREIWAEDVKLTSGGLRFSLCHKDGHRAEVVTRLLGRHNVSNVLVAGLAALHCGLSFDELVAAIPQLDPIEHRLQLVPNDNGVVVIDDTYNSNPRGAAMALETLATFTGGRRYLVTPGMIELADMQEEAHRDFGRLAARVCDGVILVGPKQTRAIADGLVEAGFRRERLIVTRNLAEASDKLKTLLRRGDAVLFENDLPDNYNE